MEEHIGFGRYARIKQLLNTPIPKDAKEKEEFRLELYDTCLGLELDVKEGDLITFLKNKLKQALKDA